MRIPVILQPGEDGWIVASAPTLPGCFSQGMTRDEALANIQEAIELWLEVEADDHESGAPAPGAHELVELEVGTAGRSVIKDSIADYKALKPWAYSDISAMRMTFRYDYPCRIELEYNKRDEGNRILRMTFDNIADLSMPTTQEGKFGTVYPLVIEDISGFGWENLNYKVLGVEDDISFYCGSFSCEIVDS